MGREERIRTPFPAARIIAARFTPRPPGPRGRRCRTADRPAPAGTAPPPGPGRRREAARDRRGDPPRRSGAAAVTTRRGFEPRIRDPKSLVLPITPPGNRERHPAWMKTPTYQDFSPQSISASTKIPPPSFPSARSAHHPAEPEPNPQGLRWGIESRTEMTSTRESARRGDRETPEAEGSCGARGRSPSRRNGA